MVNQLYPNNSKQNNINWINSPKQNSNETFRAGNTVNTDYIQYNNSTSKADLPFKNMSLKDSIPDINIKEIRENAKNEIPLARNIEEKKDNPLRTMLMLFSGIVLGPVFSKLFQNICKPDGFLVKTAESISNHTKFFDNSSLVRWIINTKNNLLKGPNLNIYSEGLKRVSLLSEAKDRILSLGGIINDPLKDPKKIEKAILNQISQKNTIEVLGKVEKMGILGKWFGKAGVILKNNTTGYMKYIQGVMAALTVNNVVQAKEGEKFSTFMQELLGNWIGNIYGFRFIHKYVVNGLGEFIEVASKTPKDKLVGLLPKMGKVLSHIPGPLRGLIGFALPLGGSFLFSWALQKLSHKLFGKPTSEEPKKNAEKDKLIDNNADKKTNIAKMGSVQNDELSNWLLKTGWNNNTKQNTSSIASNDNTFNTKSPLAGTKISDKNRMDFENNSQSKVAASKLSKKSEDPDYYLPSSQLSPDIVKKYTGKPTQDLDNFEKDLTGISEELEKIGIHV